MGGDADLRAEPLRFRAEGLVHPICRRAVWSEATILKTMLCLACSNTSSHEVPRQASAIQSSWKIAGGPGCVLRPDFAFCISGNHDRTAYGIFHGSSPDPRCGTLSSQHHNSTL